MTLIALSFLLFCALNGAFWWRLRGGGIVALGSTQAARALGALGVTLPLVGWTLDPWTLLLAPALFAGLCLVGWGDFMDMGRTEGRSRELVSPLVRWLGPRTLAHDIAGMSLTGLVLLAPASAALWWLGAASFLLLVPALLMGPLYALAWTLRAEGTELAEWLWGGLLGLAAALAVILPLSP